MYTRFYDHPTRPWRPAIDMLQFVMWDSPSATFCSGRGMSALARQATWRLAFKKACACSAGTSASKATAAGSGVRQAGERHSQGSVLCLRVHATGSLPAISRSGPSFMMARLRIRLYQCTQEPLGVWTWLVSSHYNRQHVGQIAAFFLPRGLVSSRCTMVARSRKACKKVDAALSGMVMKLRAVADVVLSGTCRTWGCAWEDVMPSAP
jgi:hypothetical protein